MSRILDRTGARWVLAICLSLALPGPAYAQVQGQVVGPDGQPLSGVSVWSGSGRAESDDQGNFTLKQGKVIGFSKPGYRPVTKLSADLIANPVVRMQSPSDTWKAPACAGRRAPRSTMSGAHMRFVLPAAARLRRATDVDYQTNVVCNGADCLEHGWGSSWSSGSRVSDVWVDFFANVRQMSERDMFDVPNDFVSGQEYRGVRTDGTRFRWVGVWNETIGYDHASVASAALFDTIIDSLCWF